MDKLDRLLPEVWKEVCRHLELSESLPTVAGLLREHLPPAGLAIRELEPSGTALLTLAAAGLRGAEAPGTEREPIAPAAARDLAAWWRRGRAARAIRPVSPAIPWRALVPAGEDGMALAVPLDAGKGAPCALVVVTGGPHRLEGRHEQACRALVDPLSTALDNDRRLRELAALRDAAETERQSLLQRLGRSQLVDDIVGTDGGLQPVMERAHLVARSDAPVLILGETGAGKEVLARAIHQRSPRAAGAFLRVNCGAIPLELVDSQLFGHERGSFTGATEMRKGWFERADGGTLFLDEIGELPLAAQVRLLRILQDGSLERVGGQEPIHVNVRIIAATHRDLAAMARDGKFREDLWYRIAVFPILLPPLRERPEDIPALAAHFAERAARRFGVTSCSPTPADLRLLGSYPWPGNVRELATVIDRAVILGNGQRLEVASALGLAAGPAVAAPAGVPVTGSSRSEGIKTLAAAQREHIERALAAVHGRVEGPHGAAVLLGINPHTLRARMRKLGIDWGEFRHGGAAR